MGRDSNSRYAFTYTRFPGGVAIPAITTPHRHFIGQTSRSARSPALAMPPIPPPTDTRTDTRTDTAGDHGNESGTLTRVCSPRRIVVYRERTEIDQTVHFAAA